MRGASANSLSTIEEDAEETRREYQDETVSPETTYHYAVLALSQDGTASSPMPSAPPRRRRPHPGNRTKPRDAPKKEDPPQRVGARQVDTTAPTVSSAQTSTDGSQIQITISETLATTTPPYTSAFEVTTDAEPHPTSGTVTFSTAVASFTVSPSISQGQAVVVTYTDPTQTTTLPESSKTPLATTSRPSPPARPASPPSLTVPPRRPPHRRPHQPHGQSKREFPDRPLLDRPGRQRRPQHHQLQDRGLLRWRQRLDRPRRQHRRQQQDLRAHRAGPQQHPPLPRLGHQQHRNQQRIKRQQRHH